MTAPCSCPFRSLFPALSFQPRSRQPSNTKSLHVFFLFQVPIATSSLPCLFTFYLILLATVQSISSTELVDPGVDPLLSKDGPSSPLEVAVRKDVKRKLSRSSAS